jgi:hypothetical protein
MADRCFLADQPGNRRGRVGPWGRSRTGGLCASGALSPVPLPTSITYPTGADTYVYNAFGQRTRASLSGSIFRYVYHGDRVLEQTGDTSNPLSRYATAGPSYHAPLLGFEFPDGSQRYPLYDMAGTARRLADATGTMTDAYSLDAFGRSLGGGRAPRAHTRAQQKSPRARGPGGRGRLNFQLSTLDFRLSPHLRRNARRTSASRPCAACASSRATGPGP